MIEVEGRVLAGLDEFMLRVGHLALLVRVAHEVGASWSRIQRMAAEQLGKEIRVSDEDNNRVAEYLAAKELCADTARESQRDAANGKDYRYPQLRTYRDSAGNRRVRSTTSSESVHVSWQDFHLSHPEVRSRVGALSLEGKSGSKTGISHVCDWAQFLELIDTAGRLSPIGRLVVTLPDEVHVPFDQWNPYLPSRWAIFIAYEYFRRDLDLLAHYVPLISAGGAALQKAKCRTLFVQALREAAARVEAARDLTSRSRFDVLQQVRDLEKAAKRGKTVAEELSTSWHRAASRVETLTDFGFLAKGHKDQGEKYQYIYYPTRETRNLADSLRQARSAEQWLDDWFVSVFSGETLPGAVVLTEEQLIRDIDRVVRALSLPTSVLPIDCLALGVVFQRLDQEVLSFGSARKAIENLPVVKPELARLARGREGTRAEYISLNLKAVSER